MILPIHWRYWDWSDDIYSDIKLDSQTKLEEGDFIVLYKGEYGNTAMEQVGDYLEVAAVAPGGTVLNPVGDECEYVIITTKQSSLEEIAESGDTSCSRPYDVMDKLTPEQIEEIEENAKEDAKTSGFLEEAGIYLARTAMATEGFTSLDGVEEIEGLEDYDFVVKDATGDVIGDASGLYDKYKGYSNKYKKIMSAYKQFSDDEEDGSVQVYLEYLNVNLVKAQHLTGGMGVHMNVKFDVEVTIPTFEGKLGGDENQEGGSNESSSQKSDSDKGGNDKLEDAGEDKLRIVITAEFVQELQLDTGFEAKVEWKKIGFIPYPADIIFSPSFTTGTYTGINVEAIAATDGDGMGSILDDGKEIYKDISKELKNLLDADAVESDENAEEVTNWLAVKYKQMLSQKHNPIKLVEFTICEANVDICPVPGIIQFVMEIRFQVTVDAVVTLGMEFSNVQSKKTIYNIHVLQGKCQTETVELIPAELDFKFYVMGTMELKVGFEIELGLQLLEGILGRASLTFCIGAYVDTYGFFYYHVHILKGKKTETSAGALYVQLGIYLELGAGARVGKNFEGIKGQIAAYKTNLFEKRFPLKDFGRKEVPLNFKVLQEDVDDIELHQYVKMFVIPDEYYEVTTLGMTQGSIRNVTYDNDYYGVKLSNEWFEYDPNTHTVFLKDGYPKMEAECTATLYFKNGYIPLSKTKMERTIEITWDNYLDGYAITPMSEGGSYVAACVGKFGAAVKKPKDPTRKGYVFKDEPYKSYFNSQAWYNPNPSAKMNLNEIEKYNVNFLLEYERSQGMR